MTSAGPVTPPRGPGPVTWADGGALLAVLLWGAGFPVMKAAMTAVPPLPFMLLRGAISTALLVAVLRARGAWRLPAGDEWGPLLAVALGGYTVNQVLYGYGLHLTSASHSGLIFTLTPLFVFVMSHWLGHTRMSRLDVAGLSLGLAGALLIVGVPRDEGPGGARLVGDLLTVGAAVMWGVWTILAAPVLRRHGTFLGTAWITGVGTLGLLPVALPGLVLQDWRLPWATTGAILYSSTAAGALGSLLWYGAVRRLGAARTAIYANMESLFAVAAAALVLGERVAWTAMVGGVAVIGGVLLTRRRG